MALLYPWATKEYLLWEMSIGQVILYHNRGMDLKYGTGERKPGLLDKSAEELRKMRDEAKAQASAEKAEATKAAMRAKYGDV